MKMKEIADNRKQLGTGIAKMEKQLRTYREYLVQQQARESDMLDAAAKEAIRRTQQDKKQKRSKGSMKNTNDAQSHRSGKSI